MSEIKDNAEALAELDADNARRAAALTARGFTVKNVQSGYTNYLLETILAKIDGPEAVAETQLGYSGVVSRMLDDAEKKVDAAERKNRLQLPGLPWR